MPLRTSNGPWEGMLQPATKCYNPNEKKGGIVRAALLFIKQVLLGVLRYLDVTSSKRNGRESQMRDDDAAWCGRGQP